MAEEKDSLLPEFDENEEDVLLQTQMKIYNFLMGNWKKGLVVVGVGLVVILVRGLYFEHVQDTQRGYQSEIELLRADLPEPNPMSVYGLVPQDNPNDMKRMEKLRNIATSLESVASKSEGSAQWFAWMEAAKAWHRANEMDAEIAALQKAIESSTDDVFRSSTTLKLANRYAESEKMDEAVSTLEAFVATNPAVGKEQAQLNLALIFDELGNKEKANEMVNALAGSAYVSAPAVQEMISRITVP